MRAFWSRTRSTARASRDRDRNSRDGRTRERIARPSIPEGLARQSAALIVAPPRNAVLRQLRCPALVLHGDADPVIPVAAGKDTAESIPGAELIVVPGMSHDFGLPLVPVYLKHIGDFVVNAEARAPSAG